jgi:glycosyltransferase involved in cell wall biosynthesis
MFLNNEYSTTRQITKEIPKVTNSITTKYQSYLFLPFTKYCRSEGGLRTKGYFKKSSDKTPLISVITVVFNGARFLEQTINSVIKQTYNCVEYIIIDGGSNDATLDILRKHENKIDYWISEKDGGIYDAMNKGISLSLGNWLYFLNASDIIYSSSIFKKVVSNWCLQNGPYIHTGKVGMIDEEGEYLGYTHPNTRGSLDRLKLENCVAHQSTFVNKKVFNEIGVFKLLKIHGDYEFWIRSLTNGKIQFHFNDEVIALMRNDGVSSQRANYLVAQREMLTIMLESKIKSKFMLNLRYIFRALVYYLKTLTRFIVGKRLSDKIALQRSIKSR